MFIFRIMRDVGQNLGIPLFVFGPETHMTAIVGMALGKRPIPTETEAEFSTANFLLPGGQDKVHNIKFLVFQLLKMSYKSLSISHFVHS